MASNLILAKFRKLATKTGYTTIKCEDIKELIDAIAKRKWAKGRIDQ